MKLVVLGRGLASMGFLWNVAKLSKRPDEIYWIGHNGIKTPEIDSHYCSFYSTALVARQGIEEGVSPLGDLLFRSYKETLEFLAQYGPPGVTKLRRFHLSHDESSQEKLIKRFGPTLCLNFNGLSLGQGHEEEAISFNPEIFLSWFEQEILKKLPQIEVIEDLVYEVTDELICTHGHGEFAYDKLANCTGAFGLDFPSVLSHLDKRPKKAVGHFLFWDQVKFENRDIGEQSFTLTWKGHNLIYRHDDHSIVWGGSTYGDGICAPRSKDLELDLQDLWVKLPSFRFSGQRELRTGVRSKGPRRQPIVNISADGNQLTLNGYYKNGWTLCHTLGQDGVKLLFS